MNHNNTDESWRDQAECRHANQRAFFPELGETRSDVYGPAREVCNTCTVQEACLQYALDNCIPFGMWGGKTPRERRNLKATPIRMRATA